MMTSAGTRQGVVEAAHARQAWLREAPVKEIRRAIMTAMYFSGGNADTRTVLRWLDREPHAHEEHTDADAGE